MDPGFAMLNQSEVQDAVAKDGITAIIIIIIKLIYRAHFRGMPQMR